MRISDWNSDVCSSDLIDVLSREELLEVLLQDADTSIDHDVVMPAHVVARDDQADGPGALAVQEHFPGLYDDRIGRSEERRVGKECGRPCRSRWSSYH